MNGTIKKTRTFFYIMDGGFMDLKSLKQKWETADIHAVRDRQLRVEKGFFYVCSYYFADVTVDFEMKPVVRVTSFESSYDAVSFLRYSALPGFNPEKSGMNMEALYMLLDKCLSPGGPDIENGLLEETRLAYNKIFEFRHPNMPYLGRWGSLKDVLKTDVLVEILANKRVRIKNAVLKGLLDVNKFDEENKEHLLLAERFLKLIDR
jgi:hypothetical protein